MSSERQIRVAEPADAEVLRDLAFRTYRDHFAHVWTPQGMVDFLERDFSLDALAVTLARPEVIQYGLVFDAGRAVGFWKVNWSSPDPAENEHGAELQKIYFLGSEAGKGHGAAAMEYILAQAGARGEPTTWLQVFDTNVGARRFYRRFGFSEVGATRATTDCGEYGMRVMKHRLTGAR